MMKTLVTISGEIATPAFLPDATRGVVRAVDMRDLEAVGVQALMVNVLHLGAHPGVSVVSQAGGIRAFTGWHGVVASDSGGFQVHSLAARSKDSASVTDRGFSYRPGKGRAKKTLTPEKSIRWQFDLHSDILFCLDQFTDPRADAASRRESVDRTVAWARRCKDEFVTRLEQAGYDPADGIDSRPILFAVVQGGEDPDLRRRCAGELVEIGFDGYAYGGWPVVRRREGGGRLADSVGLVAELVGEFAHEGALRFALGVGKPESIVACAAMGYDLFDCVLPTRDARHKRLYVANDDFAALTDAATLTRVGPGEAEEAGDAGRDCYRHLYTHDDEHRRDTRPVDETCDCPCCREHTRAYLHHLFQVGDACAWRLATLHNLRFYTRLMARLRELRASST